MAGVNFVTDASESDVRYVAKKNCKIPDDVLLITNVGKSAKGRERIQVEADDYKWENQLRKLFFIFRDAYGYKTTSGSIVGSPDPE